MIKLRNNKKGKKFWNLTIDNPKLDKEPMKIEVQLVQHSLSNRFEIVQDIFSEMNQLVPEFSDFYFKLLTSYTKSGFDPQIPLKKAKSVVKFAKKYIDNKNIDFSQFVNKNKKTKTSIFFDEKDIYSIGVVSTCLKLYSIFYCDYYYRIPENILKEIFDIFMQDCKINGTVDKIFEVIKARTYRSTITDKYMWVLIKSTIQETPDTTVMSVFNFFISNLLSLLNIEQNPVHYLVKISDDAIKWLMSEIYKEKVLYDDNYADELNSTNASKDMFYNYCCTDVINKYIKIALEKIKIEFNMSDDEFVDFNERLDDIKYIDLSMKLFNIPLISKSFDIPFKHLLKSSPKHIALLSLLIYTLSKDTIVKEYPILSNFLLTYSKIENFILFKSSYKIRNIDSIIQNTTPVFGVNSKKLKYELLSTIIGTLNSSKKNLYLLENGKKLNSITYFDLETDCIEFYTKLYSNKLSDYFNNIEIELDALI